MNKKNGFTIVILVIYIIIILILFGITAYKFTDTQRLENTEELVFKARITDYMEEYEKNKNYNILLGNDINQMTIEDFIPSITLEDKSFLKISDSGNLMFYNLEPTDLRYQYLLDLGLSEFNVEIIDLQITKGESIEKSGVNISIGQDDTITINGVYNNIEKGAFFRLSNGMLFSNTYTDLKQLDKVIVGSGSKLRFEEETISGSISGANSTDQFNISLRDAQANSSYIIRVLDGQKRNPYNDTFLVATYNINYVYFFIKGNVTFDNYKIKLSLLKEPENYRKETTNNSLNMSNGLVQNTGNLSIEVLNDYSIKIDGTSNIDKLYVLFLKDYSIGLSNSLNEVTTHITDKEFVVGNGTTIKFEVEEISGNKTIPSGKQFNVLLRGYDDSTNPISSPIISYNNDVNNQFNCKLGNNITSITGKITSRDARILGLYINSEIEFNEYIFKPKLTVIE